MISLLMPTRSRPAWVERFFSSVIEHSEDLNSVEVVLYIDEDDVGSHHLDNSKVRVERIIGPRMSMGSYNTACLERSCGDIVILVNDDMMIKTPGWDEKIKTLSVEFSDGIYLAYGNDLFKGGKLCTFPILSRHACRILVDPYPKDYQGAFIDYHLFDIFQRLKKMGHKRIRYLDDVVFEHMHFRAGKADKDSVYTQRDRFGDDPVFVALRNVRVSAAKRLRIAIEEGDTADIRHRNEIPIIAKTSVLRLTKAFLFDKSLPICWRFFLWYWFLGRYAASNGWLRPFVH